MYDFHPLLRQTYWRYIDETTSNNALSSFAIDDTLCQTVGLKHSGPTIHSWVHDKTIVLGIQDSRLPYIQEGIDYITNAGWQVIVRNSGGLAVVLDPGILNLSIILPDEKISINEGYEAMYSLINNVLAPYNTLVEAREIVGSYCPGSYDLSINGKKFAGISQRRVKHGIAVQIYICCDGSGANRAQFIKEFYQLSTKGEQTKFTYPSIEPNTMASLTELLQQAISVNTLIDSLFETLSNVTNSSLSREEIGLFNQNLERILARNDKALNR